MRKVAVFSSPFFVAALMFACQDDKSPAEPAINVPDSGFDGNTPPPAPQPDGATPDAGPLPVTVVVKNVDGTAAANITVVFHDTTGAVLATVQTAADGTAVSTATPAPAMATVVFGQDGNERDVLTWTNVQAGDVLPVVAPITKTLAEFQVTLPGVYDDVGTTVGYSVQVGDCEVNTPSLGPVSVFLDRNCFTGAGAVLVEGHDEAEAIIAFTSKKGVQSATDGGVVPVTTEAWIAPPTDVTVTVQNGGEMGDGEVWFSQIANNTAFYNRTGTNDAHEAVFHTAGGFAEALNANVMYRDNTTTRIVGKRVAPTAAIAVDVAALPTQLTAASVTNTATDRPTANWTGNMSGMKGGVVRLDWGYYDQNEDFKSTHWSIVVPANTAGAGSVTVPALPATLANIVPQADGGSPAEWSDYPEVDFVDSDLLPDYATWKKVQGVLFTTSVTSTGRIERVVLPQAGNFKITNFHQPPIN